MLSAPDFKTIIDLILTFKTEKECHFHLASRRWADGVVYCAHCNYEKVYVFADGIRYKCQSCLLNFTAKSNTFMDSSKLPTIKWLTAMYLILHKRGISSVQLSKDVGVTQKTAWFMLQRLRAAFGNLDQEQLSGTVEIDETFVGGANKNRHKNKRIEYKPGRSWSDKTPVMGMLERGEHKIVKRAHKVINGKTVKEKIITKEPKLRACAIKDVSMLFLKKVVENNIDKGSTLLADGFTGYKPLRLNYDLQQVDHAAGKYVDGAVHTNTIESVWNQLKGMIRGSYIRLTKKHLDRYIDELVFKYNHRSLGIPQQMNIILNNMVCRLKYKDLIAP